MALHCNTLYIIEIWYSEKGNWAEVSKKCYILSKNMY